MKYTSTLFPFGLGILIGLLLLFIFDPFPTTNEVVSVMSSTTSKIAYLTFDDGPSTNTGEILDILDQYEIKATFFVLVPYIEEASEYLLRASKEGHSIGVHTSSHIYEEIYASTDAYVNDFELAYEYIQEITGVTPTIFRFPGGSINAYNGEIRDSLITLMTEKGFTYYDWNVDSQDSNPNTSISTIYTNVMDGVANKTTAMIIFHDASANTNTVSALEDIIVSLLDQGYTFLPIDASTEPIQFNW